MTKPKNFPGVINRRRIGALERLPTKGHEKERVILLKRIISTEAARAIKTKKFRGKDKDGKP